MLAIILWFFGTTVIGLPIVFGIILYRGFCLGYTIAVVTSILWEFQKEYYLRVLHYYYQIFYLFQHYLH